MGQPFAGFERTVTILLGSFVPPDTQRDDPTMGANWSLWANPSSRQHEVGSRRGVGCLQSLFYGGQDALSYGITPSRIQAGTGAKTSGHLAISRLVRTLEQHASLDTARNVGELVDESVGTKP